MKAAGIIVEFNPLHDGHIEHINETRRLTGRSQIIAVMSGNFVQRGEPAIIDKWQRTKMALEAGVDIVIELPVPYVISGADYFARGAVNLLAATKVVDALCFGSESGEITPIKEAGRILAHEPPEYKEALRHALDKGLSFAAARGAALNAILESTPEGLLTKPNNGLGMEYCKALWQLGWPMEVFTSYRAPGGPSATAIRKKAADTVVRLEDFSEIFRYLLCTTNPNMGEGLENRFRRYAKDYTSLTPILDAVKTKRYTYTRLQRAVLGVVLGITPPKADPPYIRILGFKRDAATLLGELTKKATLPVLTTGPAMDSLKGAAANLLAKELEVGDVYNLVANGRTSHKHERGLPIIKV